MRVWWDEWAKQVRVFKECSEYPNGRVTHGNWIVKLNGEVMSMVLYADSEKGSITFLDKIGGGMKTKTGNVSIEAMKAAQIGPYSHVGPPLTAEYNPAATKL